MKRERKLTEQEELDEEANRRAARQVPGVGNYFGGELGLSTEPAQEEKEEKEEEYETIIEEISEKSEATVKAPWIDYTYVPSWWAEQIQQRPLRRGEEEIDPDTRERQAKMTRQRYKQAKYSMMYRMMIHNMLVSRTAIKRVDDAYYEEVSSSSD